jgi:hypothetical protein
MKIEPVGDDGLEDILHQPLLKQRTLRWRARLFAADAALPAATHGFWIAQGGWHAREGFAEYGRSYCSAAMR